MIRLSVGISTKYPGAVGQERGAGKTFAFTWSINACVGKIHKKLYSKPGTSHPEFQNTHALCSRSLACALRGQGVFPRCLPKGIERRGRVLPGCFLVPSSTAGLRYLVPRGVESVEMKQICQCQGHMVQPLSFPRCESVQVFIVHVPFPPAILSLAALKLAL